jgi:4-carboxymuconolactone decarboxylase
MDLSCAAIETIKRRSGMNEVREQGVKLFGEIMGAEREVEFRKGLEAGGFGGAITALAAEFAFGSVWTRPGLERKQRSLVVIGMLIAQHQPSELKNHFRVGLTNGLTKQEIEEAVLQSVPYCGFPAAASAASAMLEVFRERGLDTVSKTAEERGLL